MLLILLILSPILLVSSICYLLLWHKAHRAEISSPLYENALCHIGITIGIERPKHLAQIISALDSRYPLYEVVVATDLATSPINDLIQRYHLVRVNAEQLLSGTDARGLYRSHHRPHQQVVVVDLPDGSATSPYEAIERVASYPYLLSLASGALLCHDSVTYAANIIASYPLDEEVCIRSIVGARVSVEPIHPSTSVRFVISPRILAYSHSRRIPRLCAMAALIAPIIPISISIVAKEEIALLPAILIIIIGLIGIYLSCRIVTKRGLFTTFGTITINFCRFLVEDMRNFCYLYKKCEGVAPPNEFGSLLSAHKEKTCNYDKTDKELSSATRYKRRHSSGSRDYEGVPK